MHSATFHFSVIRSDVQIRLEISRLEMFRLEKFRLKMFRLEMVRLKMFRLEILRLGSEMLRLEIVYCPNTGELSCLLVLNS